MQMVQAAIRPFALERQVSTGTICYSQLAAAPGAAGTILTHKNRETMEALGNLQVVDLTSGIAGPIVGMFMADFGAEVVKIEPPGGDPTRDSPGFSMWNRGKKSVVVDPDNRDQCRWLGDLISGADVCIVKDLAALRAYGLSAEGLARRNARLIIVETPPYARAT